MHSSCDVARNKLYHVTPQKEFVAHSVTRQVTLCVQA